MWTGYECKDECAYAWRHTRVLTASVINLKASQTRNIISQDDFVAPRGLVDSFNNLILLVRVVKEGAMDRKTPRVGQVVHQDHPLRAVHVPSFNLKDQKSCYSLVHTEWSCSNSHSLASLWCPVLSTYMELVQNKYAEQANILIFEWLTACLRRNVWACTIMHAADRHWLWHLQRHVPQNFRPALPRGSQAWCYGVDKQFLSAEKESSRRLLGSVGE